MPSLAENHLMTAPIIVSGASGFVGRSLCGALAMRGMRVEALVRRAGSAPQGVAAEHVVGDLSLGPDLGSLLAGAAAVVHCAGVASVPSATRQDEEDRLLAANLEMTRWLAEQAADAGVGRFLLMSTAKVSAEQTVAGQALSEADAPRPTGIYAHSKYLAEQALADLSAQRSLPVVVIRPPLVYGPGVIGNMRRLLQFVDRGFPLPFAGLENRRSLIGVDNLCDFVACALSHPAALGETFFVADARAVSTTELVLTLATALQRKARLFRVHPGLLRVLRSQDNLSNALDRLFGSLLVDTTKAQTQLGWDAPVAFEDGVDRMVDWYRRAISPRSQRHGSK